jgi:hypothetical protein
MKNIIPLVILVITSSFVLAQEIEIKQALNPYNKTLQWGDKGTILIAEDANGVTFKRTLHFITAEGESSWQKEFLPKVKNPIPVFSDESKYIYFFDQVKDLEQTITFTQFGPSGVSSPKSIRFRNILLQQLGKKVNSSLYKVEEIKTVENDLVILFSHFDKSTDVYRYAIIRMDHNTLKSKAVFVPEQSSGEAVENGQVGHVTCIGSQGSTIYFSRNVFKKDDKSNQLFILGPKNNWSQKNLKYVPSYAPYPSNALLNDYGNINNSKPGRVGKEKLDFRTNAGSLLKVKNKLINYAFTSKDGEDREGIRIFMQDFSGTTIWDKNILFSEFISDEVLSEKGKAEDLFLDVFASSNQLFVIANGKQTHQFIVNLTNGSFKKQEKSVSIESLVKNPNQLVYGNLVESGKVIEIALNNGIYVLKPLEIEKGHLFLKKK